MTKQDWKIDVAKLCQRMAGRKDAEFFKEPVDWESLGLLDYPTIISKPMDLKTLRQNLDKGIYSRPGEFAADMRLIFSNAMTYNIPGSRVYNHAKSLGDFFETSWVQLVNDCDDIDKPPTKETLTVFVEKVHFLQPEELAKVLYIIEEHCPNSIVKKPDSAEVDVNTDLISGKALLEANKYMDSLLYVDEKGNFKVPHELSVASPASKESSTKPKDAIISKRRVRPADEEDLTSPTDASKNKARKLIQS